MEAKEFGKYLRRIRKDKKLTIRQLELYSGVSNGYLSQLETGKRGIPSPDVIKKLHQPLGVTYEEMMMAAGHLSFSNMSSSSRIKADGNNETIFKNLTPKQKAFMRKVENVDDGIIEILEAILDRLIDKHTP